MVLPGFILLRLTKTFVIRNAQVAKLQKTSQLIGKFPTQSQRSASLTESFRVPALYWQGADGQYTAVRTVGGILALVLSVVFLFSQN